MVGLVAHCRGNTPASKVPTVAASPPTLSALSKLRMLTVPPAPAHVSNRFVFATAIKRRLENGWAPSGSFSTGVVDRRALAGLLTILLVSKASRLSESRAANPCDFVVVRQNDSRRGAPGRNIRHDVATVDIHHG